MGSPGVVGALSETGQVFWVGLVIATCYSGGLREQLQSLGESCSYHVEC